MIQRLVCCCSCYGSREEKRSPFFVLLSRDETNFEWAQEKVFLLSTVTDFATPVLDVRLRILSSNPFCKRKSFLITRLNVSHKPGAITRVPKRWLGIIAVAWTFGKKRMLLRWTMTALWMDSVDDMHCPNCDLSLRAKLVRCSSSKDTVLSFWWKESRQVNKEEPWLKTLSAFGLFI